MTLFFSSSKSLFYFCKMMLLAPVSATYNPETMEDSYVFHEWQFRMNVSLVIFMAVGEVLSMYWRFQELRVQTPHWNTINSDSDHFIPDNMLIFVAFISSSMFLAICGVVRSKTNFYRLLSLHRILRRVDNQLRRPVKRGKFKYVTVFILSLTIFLLALDCWAWKFTTTEWWIFSSSFMSRLMCATILVQYEDIICNVKNRFHRINVELECELANFFKEKDSRFVARRNHGMLPVRYLSRRRVEDLFQLFWLTCRCVPLVNEAYGGIIFGMVLMISFQLIAIPHYFLIPMFQSMDAVSLVHKICAFCDVMWMCSFCCQIFVLVSSPAFASAEANRAAVIVCKYLNTDTEEYFLKEVIGITLTYLLITIQIRNAASQM